MSPLDDRRRGPMARREPELGTLPRGRRGTRPGARDDMYRPRSGSAPETEYRGGGNRKLVVGLLALVLLIGGALLVLPPVLGGVFRAMAEQNPDWLRLPFVADSVRADMVQRVDQPAGTDPTPVDFVVQAGSSSRQITDQLAARELVTDKAAFAFVLIEEDLGSRLQAGTHSLNRTMTPREVARTLASAPVPPVARATVSFREGLRIEQMTAQLQNEIDELEVNAEEFHSLATNPSAALRQDYEWLRVVPEGRSLEGFLGSGVFEIERGTTAEQLVRMLLDRWASSGAHDLLAEAEANGRNFYEVMTLASIVEREATLPEEAPLIAGVFQNRLDGLNNGNRLLNADPTVIYAKDTIMLRRLPLSEWPTYTFWTYDGLNDIANFTVPPDLAGYHSWRTRGLPPGPLCSPSVASIEAALRPDAEDGYLYFVARADGSRSHVFAKTYEDHLRNIDEIRNATPRPTQ